MLLTLLAVIYSSAAFQYAPGCQPWDWLMHLHSEYSCLKVHVTARVLFNRHDDA